jgi:CheY-like chemotaxis protein
MVLDDVHILLAEDNPADVWLFQETIKTADASCNVQILGDGEKALAFIRGEDDFVGRELPKVIFLDLNLPRVSGQEVIAAIRRDCRVDLIPIVVLSSTMDPTDVCDVYKLGANCLVQKPGDYDAYTRIDFTLLRVLVQSCHLAGPTRATLIQTRKR